MVFAQVLCKKLWGFCLDNVEDESWVGCHVAKVSSVLEPGLVESNARTCVCGSVLEVNYPNLVRQRRPEIQCLRLR